MGSRFTSPASIPRLPSDILHEIFLYLCEYQDSWHRLDLSTINLYGPKTKKPIFLRLLSVSRQFYFVARPFLYRTISLYRCTQVQQLYRTLTKSPALSSHVRHLFFAEQQDWTGVQPDPGALPRLWQSVQCQRPKTAVAWNTACGAQRDVALQLVAILWCLENLRTFRYRANIDPLHRSPRNRGSTFDWIFTALVSNLASRAYGYGFLYSLEEVDIAGLSPPNKVAFLRAFFKLPNLRSLSLTPASHLPTQLRYFPASLSQSIRELRVSDPISLRNLPGLLRAVAKLKVLHLDICPHAFASHMAYPWFKEALETQHGHLRELHISSRTPCNVHYGYNDRPWSLWKCTNLRTLSIPAELYNHYRRHITLATHFLVPPRVDTLIVSHWHFNSLQPDHLDCLVEETAVCLQLRKVVLQDLVGGQADRMSQFVNVQQVLRERNVAFVYEGCSGVGEMRTRENKKCPWRWQ
ncbi:hypothetical protein BJY00DRAFT_319397 [Aspergillus carlsbadensis]|nr:hypothetical protein BJY00DRAFT_319397 [Aspergillus carlsbadensis]